MPHDHPGFDYWDIDDHDHPFPVGDIEIAPDTEDAIQAEAEPIPEGAMTPGRPGGVLAGIVGFFKRLAWGLFG